MEREGESSVDRGMKIDHVTKNPDSEERRKEDSFLANVFQILSETTLPGVPRPKSEPTFCSLGSVVQGLQVLSSRSRSKELPAHRNL